MKASRVVLTLILSAAQMLFPPLAACSDSATLSTGQKIVVVYQNGDRYEGEAENGIRSGRGRYCWNDGSCYEGDFYESRPHGRGKMTWTCGTFYIGDFFAGRLHGAGTLFWPDGGL